MKDIEDCYKEKLLRKVRPSPEKARESLMLASAYLDDTSHPPSRHLFPARHR